MSKGYIALGVCALLLAATGLWAVGTFSGGRSGEYDAFAQCLAEKQITMYGAAWCPHCLREKSRFGSSFRFVPYVECPEKPQVCTAAGVTGYPTWIFPDGRKFEGEQGLENLSELSGCLLPVQGTVQ